MSDPKKARQPQRRKALTRVEPLHGDLMSPHRQCPAISKRTGERCKNFCGLGLRSCRMHGSGTRRAKTAAAKRIAEASGYAADMLVEFMADPSIDVKQRTVIAQDLLTRAGISGKQQVEVEVRNWEDVLDTVLVDIPDEPNSRSSDANIEDAVIVTDERAVIEAARDAATAARDEEMEERESQRRRRALRGKSPALKPTEQAAVDRKLDRMNVVDKDKHAAFLLGRMAEGQPNRSHRRTFDKRP